MIAGVPTDPPRFLHRQSQRGYTERLDKAMVAEPEAISLVEQDWQTHQAHQRERQALIATWVARRDEIQRYLDWLMSQRNGHRVERDVRQARRQLARIDQRIASV